MDLNQLEAKVKSLTSENVSYERRIPGVVMVSQAKNGIANLVVKSGVITCVFSKRVTL